MLRQRGEDKDNGYADERSAQMGSCAPFDSVDQPRSDGVDKCERQQRPDDERRHPTARAVAPRGLRGDQRLRTCVSDETDHDQHAAGYIDDPRHGQDHVMDRAVRNVDPTQDAYDHYGDRATDDLSSVSCHIKDCRRKAPNRLARPGRFERPTSRSGGERSIH